MESALKTNPNDETDLLVSESQGQNITVETKALDDFDYIESINHSEIDKNLK